MKSVTGESALGKIFPYSLWAGAGCQAHPEGEMVKTPILGVSSYSASLLGPLAAFEGTKVILWMAVYELRCRKASPLAVHLLLGCRSPLHCRGGL